MSRPENNTCLSMLSKSHENGVNNWLRWKDILYLYVWPVETGLKYSCRQNKTGILNVSLKESISGPHYTCTHADFTSHKLWNTNDLRTATTDLLNSSQQIICCVPLHE